jgi:hypothetical protein
MTILLAGGEKEMLGTLKRTGWLLGPARNVEMGCISGSERAAAMEKTGARVEPAVATGPCREDARVLRPTMIGPHMILVACPDHRARSWR